jgi:tRNA1Val (adenine37-N6)-methyltransferase
VCNPPYRKSGSGRINSAGEEAIARHEVKTDLPAIVQACVFGLRTRGRSAFIFPASRGVSLFYELRHQGLEPKRLRVVYGYPGGEAKLWLVEAVKGGNEELQVESPFYIYKERNGEYSEAMAQLYTI